MSTLKLEVKDLQKSFFTGEKKLNVLSGINASFEKGKSYAIIGVSGSGKSTLMHLLGGLDQPSLGSVFFDNKDLFKLKKIEKERFLNKNLGFVFQFHYLIKELTVLENIMMPGLIINKPRNQCEIEAKKLLESIGLENKSYDYPIHLSGGELQRVSILRAIFNKPSFLLADEPTGDLDAQNAKLIIDLLLEYQKNFGLGLIICSHDQSVYKRMEKIFTLHNGILE